MLKRRRNARCTAVADSVLMNSRTQKIWCCIVAILLSTDAAARLCARRQASALAAVFENLGLLLSNVMQVIHIPRIVQEIQTYKIDSFIDTNLIHNSPYKPHKIKFLYMFRVQNKCTNCKEIKNNTNLNKLLQYKRNWIQHVNRMPRNRLPRVMKRYSPTGRRNHGRPLKRLLDK